MTLLSKEQKRQLAKRGYRWVRSILRLNRVGDAISGDDPGANYAEAIDNLHMLALALQHLDSCIQQLNSAGVCIAGDAHYRAAWKAVSDLRDALEHEEEYVAGVGRYRERLTGSNWIDGGYSESFPIVWGNQGITSLSFMGRPYKVKSSIAAALKLEEPLLEIYDPPGWREQRQEQKNL